MPRQEVFFEQDAGGRRLQVLKIYDQTFAREAFENMDEAAHTYLWTSLKIDETYEPSDLPSFRDPDREDLLWDELLEAAREDGNLFSFFVVSEATGKHSEALFVSADWPSAEAFAKNRLLVQ